MGAIEDPQMMMFLTVVTGLSILFWLLVLMGLADNYAKEHRLLPRPGRWEGVEAPLVSIILPARNEEEMLAACMEAVLQQDYPRFELIVVNDRSTDRTGEIAEAFAARDDRVRVVHGKPLPEGWAGKCHAIDQGVSVAGGTWLLMLDTDTFLSAGCLSAAVSDALEVQADLYTLIFEARCESFWEKLVQPLFFQFILMALPLHKINDPRSKEAAAPGPFLLFRREAYEAVGGHAGMKDETVEDLRLAQRIQETGHRLFVANAVSLVHSRRRIGLKEIWHGWSRVFYSGVDKKPSLALLAFLGMAFFLFLPWTVAPVALVEMFYLPVSFGLVALFVLGLAHCLVFVAIRRLLHVFYGMDRTLAWLQGLAVLVAMAILLNSVVTAGSTRHVVWRGRRY